jgi:cytidylate kinase
VHEATRRLRGLVTIDGPSGAGKTTAASGVAATTGAAVLDAGVLYRELALRALRRARAGDSWDDAIRDSLVDPLMEASDRPEHRGVCVERVVGAVAAKPAVRAVVTAWQREWRAQHPLAIVVGRVGGVFVFPDADVKVFLTASEEIRSRRRGVRSGELHARDRVDSTRLTEPMDCHPDAVVIDTSKICASEVAARICSLLLSSQGIA